MNLRKTLKDAHSLLKNKGIDHALIGGFALAVYGLHRTTIDIDFLADGSKKALIKEAFLDNGFKLSFESDEVLQFIGDGFVDVLLANRPLSQEMLKQAQKNKELEVLVLCPEDIIGLKIQAYKNDEERALQDKADIQRLLQLPNLNLNLIKKYADLFDEWPTIEKLRIK